MLSVDITLEASSIPGCSNCWQAATFPSYHCSQPDLHYQRKCSCSHLFYSSASRLPPQLRPDEDLHLHSCTHAFCPGMDANHIRQGHLFIRFCDNYKLAFISPTTATITYYITYLTHRFSSPRSVCNCVSRIRFMHKSSWEWNPHLSPAFP